MDIFKAILDSNFMVVKGKEQVAKAGDYLAEWLATIAMLAEKSMPTAVALYDAILFGEGGGQRGPSKTLFFNITHRLARRLLLTKLVELDRDIQLYLAVLMVSLSWVGEALVLLEGIQIRTITREVFNNIFLKKFGNNYDNYGLVSKCLD